jgi:hypothetical protein
MTPKPTHYSYLANPAGGREPTGILSLDGVIEDSRRNIIHGLMKNGELLAQLPFEKIKDMRVLRAALRAMYPRNRRSA